MQLLTTVKVKTVFNSNETEFTAKCQSINASYDLKIEYDGRDALIKFPSYYQIELTKWCQLVLGLFSKQSNFKRVLFKTFSFLKCNKKLEYIFFNVNGITISVQQDSDPYELMREYYRNSHYVFIKKAFARYASLHFRGKAELFDGNAATVRQLGRVLKANNIENPCGSAHVEYRTSGDKARLDPIFRSLIAR